MSKRNFILLIIILIIVGVILFGFLYFTKINSTTNQTEGINFFSRFNPFTTKTIITPKTPPVDVSGYTPTPSISEVVEKLKLMKVSSMPIAGFTLFSKERLKEIPVTPVTTSGGASPTNTTTTSVTNTKTKVAVKPTPPPTEFVTATRYIEKAKGIIYQTFADKIEERKFSSPSVPQLYDAYFGNNGETVIMRHLKPNNETIESFIGDLPKEYLGSDTVANNQIKGYFLPDNIKDISLSPDASKIFYLFENGNSVVGNILNLKDNKKTQIFNSVFTEWLSSWGGDKNINLSTKPSSNIPGHMYTINIDKKDLNKVFGDINGLTTLSSPNGKLILYANSALTLDIYHTDTRNIDNLSLNTLPEKCTWSKTNDAIYCAVPKSITIGNYPDSWYMGENSFSDQIWKIDLKNNNTTLLVDPITIKNGEDIDGIKLAVDDGENYLFFVNKKDSFLWKLDLK